MVIYKNFKKFFGCDKPIIQAGMGPYDTTHLAAAVSKAGALGLISTVGMGPFQMPGLGRFKYSAIFGEGTPGEILSSSLDRVLDELKDFPDARFGINVPVSEEFIPSASKIIRTLVDRIKSDSEAEKKCTVLVTSAGDPLPWSINASGQEAAGRLRIKEEVPSVTWCHVVPSVRAAKRAEKADVDVVIASGREGGAHCSWRDSSSMVLIPEVAKQVSKPVVAAGGFADGRTLLAALVLGAIGIQMGTRFIATRESDFEQGWKEKLLSATDEDTLVARGFFGPMRFIRNARALDLVDATLHAAPDLYKGIPTGSSREILEHEIGGLANLFNGDIENTPILGGIVAGRIRDIPSVEDLIGRIMNEAESVLEELKAGKGF